MTTFSRLGKYEQEASLLSVCTQTLKAFMDLRFDELVVSVEKLFVKDDWDYKMDSGTIMGRIRTKDPDFKVHMAISLNGDYTLNCRLLKFTDHGLEFSKYNGVSNLPNLTDIHLKLMVYRGYELKMQKILNY